MKKIVFRADAAPHIGIGDLMSLINLSLYLDESYEKYFVIKDYQAATDLTKSYNVKNCFILDSDISLEEEIKFINNFTEQYKIDILFFEITERRLSEYIGLKKNTKKVCVSFDGYILDNMDLVIDWDVEAFKYFDKSQYPNTKFLLGHEYVILPKEFYTKKVLNRKKSTNDNKTILIAMGGADELNFTYKIISSLLKYNLNISLNIVIGSGYKDRDKLENLLQNSNISHKIQSNITNMLEQYLSCDIGIGAGGLTSSEMVASKISPILIATYEHQIARCEYFNKKGWAKYLGYKEFNDDDLIEAILNPIEPITKIPFNTQEIVSEIEKL